MVDQKLRFTAEWQDKGLKQGAKAAADSIQKVGTATKQADTQLDMMQKRMQFAANTAMQKYNQQAKETAKRQAELAKQTQLTKDIFGAMAKGVGIAIGVLVGGAKAIQQAFQYAGEGADLLFTAEKFDRLALSIGTTGRALEDDLMVATNGMVSRMDALALASDLVGLGLVKNHDQAIRLAGGVAQLGMDVGELTLALANQTTKRFDQLGISVVGFDDKLQALKDTGMAVEDAFTEAFLQQMEEQIERVGDRSETTAGQVERAEAAMQDLKDTGKILAAELLASSGGAETLTDMFKDQTVAIKALAATEPWMIFKAIREEGMWLPGILRNIKDQQLDLLLNNGDLAISFEETSIEAEMYAGVLEDSVTPETEDAVTATSGLATAMGEVNTAIGNQISAWVENIAFIKNGGLEYQKLAEEAMDLSNDFGTLAEREKAVDLAAVGIVKTLAGIKGWNADQIIKELEKMGITGYDAEVALSRIAAELGYIDGYVARADIYIETHGKVPKLPTNWTSPSGNLLPSVQQFKQQAGGDFIVPPSFTGDSFPVRATAGERVRVDTASATKNEKLMQRSRDRRNNYETANMIADAIAVRAGW